MKYFLALIGLLVSISFANAQNVYQLCHNTTGSNCILMGAIQVKYLSTASNNQTLVATGGRALFDITAFNTNAATAYLKFYNKATAPTCGTDIPIAVIPLVQNIPVNSTSIVGRLFNLGLGFCIVAGLADNDNTNATTGIVTNITYK
jgi:hypothetical protein